MVTALAPIERLKRDVRLASATLSPREAKYLVDSYYQIQDYRKASANQVRSMDKAEQPEPHAVLDWLFITMEHLEDDLRKALDTYSDAHMPGRWAKSIVGIGPVITAGLLAHIDIEKAPHVGHIYSFAGLAVGQEWSSRARAEERIRTVVGDRRVLITPAHILTLALQTKRTVAFLAEASRLPNGSYSWAKLAAALARRPWNATLKTLCWKVGQSFNKFQNHENDIYGKLLVQRKVMEVGRNERGENAEESARILTLKKIGHDTEAYKAYSQGRFPPAHLEARAERWAVKLFLSHFHAVLYYDRYGVLPAKPYPIDHLGHTTEIPIPNWPFEG